MYDSLIFENENFTNTKTPKPTRKEMKNTTSKEMVEAIERINCKLNLFNPYVATSPLDKT